MTQDAKRRTVARVTDGARGGRDLAIQIRRTPTADQVAEALRDRLLQGELPPGTRITDAAVASAAGVSRNTIREALRSLVREGLVTHEMHRGVVVTTLSEQDVLEIYAVRRIIERAAVAAAPKATADERSELEEALAHLERAATERAWARVVEADFVFHRGFVGLLANERINRFFGDLLAELRLCLSIVDTYDDPSWMVEQHRELYALAVGGETERAYRVLDQHMDDAEERVCRIAREQAR